MGAAACPECGSDEETGWAEEAEYNHLFHPYDQTPVVDTNGNHMDEEDDQRIRRELPLWQKIVSVLLAYLLASPLVTLFEPSSRGFMLLSAMLLITVAYLVVVHRMGGDLNSLFNRPPSPAYAQLLRRARGDRDLVERLIQFEADLNKGGTRREWEQDALRRWQRDR